MYGDGGGLGVTSLKGRHWLLTSAGSVMPNGGGVDDDEGYLDEAPGKHTRHSAAHRVAEHRTSYETLFSLGA
eukprot:188335-Pyramimonas_sp.AAC.1